MTERPVVSTDAELEELARAVAICVVTCQRPIWLAALLESLGRLDPVWGDTAPLLVVVDNESPGSSRAVVDAVAARLPFRLLYEVESKRGISFARNRAVAIALREGARFVAFVDDDEVVTPGWLRELLAVQRAYRADIVSGPVRPRFDDGVPGWIVRGGFFDRPRFETGTLRHVGATNNCLIARHLLEHHPEPFDARFATGGGSDMHFFKQVARGGGRIVWADQAVVEEWVPLTRARVGWLLRRAYRGGNAFTLSERILNPPGRWLVPRVVKGIARTLQGLLLAVPCVLLGRAAVVRALQKAALGVGTIAGVLGMRYEEYRAVHGR